MTYSDIVTEHFNALVPPCAVKVRLAADGGGIDYMHPTRGWKRVSFRRLPWPVRKMWLDHK